jgi:YbbR domain-containing protein
MSNALRQFLNNLGSVILALLLAFAVWIAATLQDDPFEEQDFPNVPLVLLNQPADTMIFESIVERVTVTVRAPESVLRELKISNFEATMDLSAVQPGNPAPVPIQVACDREAVRIEAWDPLQQPVHLEAVRTMTLPVEIQVQAGVATGYEALRPVVVPGEIAVRGPEPYLLTAVSVSGSMDVEGAKEDITEQVAVAPLDANGELVPGLQWTPERVEVRVAVRRKLGYKPDVEVVPDVRGDPALGYRRGIVLVDPSTVTLAGLPSELDSLPGFVETLPISVTGATESLSQRTAMTLPTSIAVVGGNFVTVTVEILPIQISRAITVAVEVQGLRPGWLATPSPSVVDVTLEGADPVLAELKPDDLQITLNLFGLSLGMHRLEPTVLAPEGVTVLSIIPETIEVAIDLAPTPTPTLTVTPTVTATP